MCVSLIIPMSIQSLKKIPRITKIPQLPRTFLDYHVTSVLSSTLEIQNTELEKEIIINFPALILPKNRVPFILPFLLCRYLDTTRRQERLSKALNGLLSIWEKIALTIKCYNHASLRHVVTFLCLCAERTYVLKLEQIGFEPLLHFTGFVTWG